MNIVRLLLILFLFGSAEAGKLLVVPSDGSHWLGMKPIVEELGRRGNQVVVVIPEASLSMGPSEHTTTLTYPVPYTKAELEGNIAEELDTILSIDMTSDLAKFQGFLFSLNILQTLTVRSTESLLFNEDLIKKLKDFNFDAILTDPFEPMGFDALLTDPFLPCGTIIAHKFSLPTVYFLRGIPCRLDEAAAKCPSPPSFVPRFFTGYSDKMSFAQRINNMILTTVEPFLCQTMFAIFDELGSRYLKKDTTYKELLSHGAIWLLRYDFTFEYPKPIMPNIVQIGGINCAKRDPLSKELEEFVNGSGEHGFVVFTLGSMVSQLPEAKARVFFEAFKQIPQRVLWRYTGPVPEDAPKNVKLMKWLPQNDLLGHPKVKAFITHGGSHGIYEGICNGVPMVMLPLFGDQGDNAQRLVSRGVAESLSIYDLSTEKLLVALKKVITDKSYKEKMTKLSAVHRDRPIEPLDLAVFWTEFVMRHKGAEHLRPAAHELNWIQYHSLDVIGFLLLILVTVIFVTVKSCMFCFRKCFRKTQKKKKE
ncbi:UDP glucuronosyltransferase 1 family polypeptide a3 [Triplophysa rosa]|uniref:UDP-glucuronosyltransferase n=1 Tax=Triplophysa rosa TaxID=992332 RepID=A0A9W8C6C0_TRIRA|nr:UDP glucuronosyltransferase 1 family polypeptide a3 [Triplophysa rosa]